MSKSKKIKGTKVRDISDIKGTETSLIGNLIGERYLVLEVTSNRRGIIFHPLLSLDKKRGIGVYLAEMSLGDNRLYRFPVPLSGTIEKFKSYNKDLYRLFEDYHEGSTFHLIDKKEKDKDVIADILDKAGAKDLDREIVDLFLGDFEVHLEIAKGSFVITLNNTFSRPFIEGTERVKEVGIVLNAWFSAGNVLGDKIRPCPDHLEEHKIVKE